MFAPLDALKACFASLFPLFGHEPMGHELAHYAFPAMPGRWQDLPESILSAWAADLLPAQALPSYVDLWGKCDC